MKKKIIGLQNVEHAWQGIKLAFKYERNFKIEVICAVVVILILFFLKGSMQDFLVILAVIFTILITELINTSIERLVDMIQPNEHPHAKIVKDMSAGFVLLAVIFSVFIGVVIFYPLIVSKFL
ncbi:MAG: diacylglycerol kinase family protein [Candidatus Moranbacteria bacterium]|nr:diacylglycerol kinase family protein [Candidatus Moranbacteria bacterium]